MIKLKHLCSIPLTQKKWGVWKLISFVKGTMTKRDDLNIYNFWKGAEAKGMNLFWQGGLSSLRRLRLTYEIFNNCTSYFISWDLLL